MFDKLADQNRMRFVFERDGYDEAMFFARQCMHVYRGAVLASKRKHGKRGVFREAYIHSYVFHKHYLRMCTVEEKK